MMQCPSCSAPLVSGEARCVSCRALVNPDMQGSSALAPRLVTPQSIEGLGSLLDPPAPLLESQVLTPLEPRTSDSKNPEDEAWRREVLERVRKRRQVRTHALPLFVDSVKVTDAESSSAASVEIESPFETELSPSRVTNGSADNNEASDWTASAGLVPGMNILDANISDANENENQDLLESADPRSAPAAPDLLLALDVPIDNGASADRALDVLPLDLRLRPADNGRLQAAELPSQSLVERSRPTLVTGPATRSLVADLPLVAPTRLESSPLDLPPRAPLSSVSSRAASISDRFQAALIDVGIWSAMSATAFYFASRIARTPILGLGHAWQGLTLFGVVLASAYILFFGGLSGATPGKIACGIHVRRYDGSSLGPLASLARGFLGILSVALLGLGIWPAFWDKDRRALHDRVTDSRVTIVS